ncbi:MAG TPA: methyltransferase domain-containing protein [Thermoleophilaceae bacterium]|jgi:SAM-dependent methyltransferase
MTGGPALDWGIGSYESTAEQLVPAARLLVERAAPSAGERVVDLGCGTGNAALLAAARGARVTGVDPAQRLLEVARERAATQKLDAEFLKGDAASIPLPDGEAALVISVFGVIFAPDPVAAAAELARVTGPAGRIVLSAWIPEGAISESVRVAREAIGRALVLPPGPPPFAWQERDALAGLFGPHGFDVSLEEATIAFTSTSAADYIDRDAANHPMAIAGNAVLEPRGEHEAVRERMIEVLEAGNEDPDAFRVTSRYVIATAQR